MNKTLTRMATAAVAGLIVSLAYAGDDTTSLSYISYLERYATVKPAGTAEALEAQINMPILSGDRIETARGARVEIQLADSSTLWLDEFTTVDFDALALSRDDPAERTALFLATGSAGIEIPESAVGAATTRVETPAGVVFLHRPGLYRLDLDGGRLHVATRTGLAEAPAGVGSTLVRAAQDLWVDDSGSGATNVGQSAFADDFWSWVEDRRHPAGTGQTARYIEGSAGSRAAILDSYGDWVWVSSFSTWMWRPRVSLTWVPYSYGRWYWTPVGWDWISYEPWGWYPSHYGSWYFDAGIGWAWCWDWVWGPAWVHWIYTPGYVGWCPRGYYDWWYSRHFEAPSPGWTRSALDFSGRVRLRDVDPRPWTIVPADSFADGRIDRVRVEPGRVFRGGDGDGFVSSGPLVTPTRSRTAPERLFAERLRANERGVPGLDSLLGRNGGAAPDQAMPRLTSVRPVETRQLIATPVRVDSGGSTLPAGERAVRSRPVLEGGPLAGAPVTRTERGRIAVPEGRSGTTTTRERGRYAPAPERVRPSGGTATAPAPGSPKVERRSTPSSPRSGQPASPPAPRKVTPPTRTNPTPSKSDGTTTVDRTRGVGSTGEVELRGGNLRSWRQEVWGGRQVGSEPSPALPRTYGDASAAAGSRGVSSRGTAAYVWEIPPRYYPKVAPTSPSTPRSVTPYVQRSEAPRPSVSRPSTTGRDPVQSVRSGQSTGRSTARPSRASSRH